MTAPKLFLAMLHCPDFRWYTDTPLVKSPISTTYLYLSFVTYSLDTIFCHSTRITRVRKKMLKLCLKKAFGKQKADSRSSGKMKPTKWWKSPTIMCNKIDVQKTIEDKTLEEISSNYKIWNSININLPQI